MRSLYCILQSRAKTQYVFYQASLPYSKQGLAFYIFMSPKSHSPTSLAMAYVFLGLGGVLLFLYFFSWAVQEHNPVKKVSIHRKSKQNYLKTEEILNLAKIKKGLSYTSRKLNSITPLLLAHPAILSAELEQKASIIYIYLRERECIAIVEDKIKKTVYDVDAEGHVLSHGTSRCKQVPLLRGAFPKDGNYLHSENIRHLLEALSQIKKAYPNLSSRFSEIRVNSEGSLTFFLLSSYLRIDVPFELNSMMIRRLYASVVYLSKQNVHHGWLDLRGPEAILRTGAN